MTILASGRPPANPHRSWLPGAIVDLMAFALGLGTAWFLDWNTTDLIWSLWLCSLVLGYLTLLSAIGAMAIVGTNEILRSEMTKTRLAAEILVGIVACLFFLGFFSLHFCGFHAGHSVFLHHFFPIQSMPQEAFGAAFMNPPHLWSLVFEYLIVPYGLFLIPAIIAERHYLLLPLAKAVRRLGANSSSNENAATNGLKKRKDPLVGAMTHPYLNVVRMHLLIFFFAGCFFLKVDSFFVYAVVYAVYFFPWRALWQASTGGGTQGKFKLPIQ